MVHPLVAHPLGEKLGVLIGDIPALLVHEYLGRRAAGAPPLEPDSQATPHGPC